MNTSSEVLPTPSKKAGNDVFESSTNMEKSSSNEKAPVWHLRRPRLVTVFTALYLAVFLVALDTTIIFTAIPSITDQFDSLDDVSWYTSSYLLTICTFQLVFGKLYGYFPIKPVFLSAAIALEIGSAVCGAAPTSNAFIVGRAVAGIGASGVFQGAMVIVAYSVERRKRPICNGIFGSIYGVPCIMGPLLGGAFTSVDNWRWCFYINLPIGAVIIVILALLLQLPDGVQSQASSKSLIQHIDPLGMTVFLPAVVCLLLALQWGGNTYSWSSARVTSLFILAGLLIIAFVLNQLKRKEKAMVPTRVITTRSIILASLFTLLFSGASYTLIYYLPIWFQAIKGASTLQSAIMCLPLTLSIIIFSFITGSTITITRKTTPFFYISTILSTTGSILLATTLESSTPHAKWIGYQILLGTGIGMGLQVPVIATHAVLPGPDIPIGTAIITFCQIFGGAIFLSIGRTIFMDRLVTGIIKAVPGICLESVREVISVTELFSFIEPEYMVAVKEVYNESLVQIWYLVVTLFAAALVGVSVFHLAYFLKGSRG